MIEGDIIALHSARSEAMFDVLFECMAVVWTVKSGKEAPFPKWERSPVKKRRGSEKERVAKARETKAEKTIAFFE